MVGRLADARVFLDDPAEASQLYNRGYFGKPRSGGGLELDLVEATYLVEGERIQVRRGSRALRLADLLQTGVRQHPNFEIRYLVYRDLRQRGYVVKPGVPPLDFRVFPRGAGPDKGPTKYWALALSERSVFDLRELESLLADVANVRKRLMLGVVDEEGDITFYEVTRASPRGSLTEEDHPSPPEALLLRDRSLIVDGEGAERLYAQGFYGKMLGEHLQLSLLETVYLLKRGRITVRRAQTGRQVGLPTLRREAHRLQPDFKLRLKIYEDLKSRGVIVKTGFKYGSHFRGYEGDPEGHHAKYLVHALPRNFTGMWPEISRAVRLAHGVRKEILIGREGDRVEYVRLERIRP